jgi:hypothetical protein
MRMLLLRPPVSALVTFIAAVALAGCGAKSVAKANVPSDPAKHAGGDVASTSAASTARANSPKLLTDPDTSRARLNPGRNAHDSVSYQSAIRLGKKMAATWPAGPAPLPGSILPAKRIVAFYGNPLVKKMGVLGEYPVDVMLAKLDTAVAAWQKADPSTPVQPALHLIAVVAQGAPGRDGMYRTRMDTALIEKVYGWAKRKNALLFLDIQVGHSTMQKELPRLLPFLSRPDVHLAMDAEFAMHYAHEGVVPGRKIGQFDAKDINWVSDQLRQLVTTQHLPPKVLVVHRWTKPMISNASQIVVDPHVQIVMDMDGWGPPWMKFESYRDYIDLEPVEYTGFKLFFHNDVKHGDPLLTPAEVLQLRPRVLYIQYQ